LLSAISFAHSALAANRTGDYSTNDNITCFDYHNGTIYMALESDRYLPVLSYPNLEASRRVSQDFNINCVNAMSDGRVLYITKRAVYQTLPTVGEIFKFYDIQEIRDYKDGYIVLTGYNKLYGIDRHGNMTLGLPFEYRSQNFTGIGTDGDRVYASDADSRILVLDGSFKTLETINISCSCPIKNIYVYGSGGSLEILVTAEDGVYLIRDGKEYLLFREGMDRCLFANYTDMICSRGARLVFFNIVDVSDKLEEYGNEFSLVEVMLAKSENCTYAQWAIEQLEMSKSARDIDGALAIVRNISFDKFLEDDCLKKAPADAEPQPEPEGGAETAGDGTATGSKNGANGLDTQAQAQIGEFPLLAVIVVAIVIAAAAYLILRLRGRAATRQRYGK